MHESDRVHPPERGPLRGLLLVLLAAAAAASGCATPGIVPRPTAGTLENPTSAIAVRIAEVSDARVFQATASRSFTPSLSGDASDPARRARAVGRSTTTSGLPGANVLLAPELTVETLVEDAMGRALRAAGFRVVEAGDPEAGPPPALRVSIEQLWMRETPRWRSAETEIEMRIRITAPLPGLEVGETVAVDQRVVRGGFTRSLWTRTLERGLDEWTRQAAERLSRVRKAAEARGGAAPRTGRAGSPFVP
jgi:hypothetical protein